MLLETYEATVPEGLENLTSEERHHIYKVLQLGCLLKPEGPPELTGVFVVDIPRVREMKVREMKGGSRSTSARKRRTSSSLRKWRVTGETYLRLP